MKYIEKLCAEDGDIVEKTLFNEYWYLPRISAIKISDDIAEMIKSIHYAFCLFIILCIIIPHNINRIIIARIHRAIAYGLSSYDEETESIRIVLKSDIKKKKRLLIILISIFYPTITVLISFCKTLDINNTSEIEIHHHRNGVSYDLPLTQWIPFGERFAFILQLVILPLNHSTVICTELMYFMVSLTVWLELKLLGISLQRLPERTLNLYNFKHNEKFYNLETINVNEDLRNCYRECLKQNVIHHQKIVR
ncbi:hypothetical protein O3M35_003063 [Rhynocoris fuscipes]|uniref:Uncharacterized protein n=1 Tax=Rhynocoris fuscipes TaxID=488301 RepID=A0AAW1CIV9_9HEMI